MTQNENQTEIEVRKKALRILEYADRTEAILREKLHEAGFKDELIDNAILYVKSYHYLDDRRFAENYLRSRSDRKSLFEIKNELKIKGVPEEIISEVIENNEVDEASNIEMIFRKKYGTVFESEEEYRTAFEKAMRYFAQKGYRYQDIKEGIKRAMNYDN